MISRGVVSASNRRDKSRLLPEAPAGLGRGASREGDFNGSTGGCIVRSRPAGRGGSSGKGRLRKLDRRALSIGASVGGGGGKIKLGVDEGRDNASPDFGCSGGWGAGIGGSTSGALGKTAGGNIAGEAVFRRSGRDGVTRASIATELSAGSSTGGVAGVARVAGLGVASEAPAS